MRLERLPRELDARRVFALILLGVDEMLVDGVPVSLQGKRMRTLARDKGVCHVCGKRGTAFFLERHHGVARYHLALYRKSNAGRFSVLMNRDHLLALADGGDDSLENSATSCNDCNLRRGSLFEKAKDIGPLLGMPELRYSRSMKGSLTSLIMKGEVRFP